MTKTVEKAPDIFEFLDIFKFLQAYYQFRKAQNSGFSYETWAEELNLKSRSYLRMVILGKKGVSEALALRLCYVLATSEKEKKYLLILTRYSQAGMQVEKNLYGQELIKILKTCADRENIGEAIDFLSNPVNARLLVMLSFEDIHPTARNFAKLLNASEDEIKKALNTLQGLNLATSMDVDGEFHWKTAFKKFDVPDNLGSVPIMRFHEMSLMDSIAAFHKPKALRRYKSVLIPLSDSELGEFYALLEDFTAQQLARFQSNSYHGRRLFQVNLNVFAVSESVGEAPKEEESPENRVSHKFLEK